MNERRMRTNPAAAAICLITMCLFVASSSVLADGKGRAAGKPASSRPGMYGLLYSLESSTNGKGPRWLTVRAVSPGGPAHEAGLRADDLIIAIEGKPVDYTDNVEVLLGLAEFKVGQKVTFSIMRQSDQLSVVIVPAAMNDVQFEQWKANLERAKASRDEAQRPN